MKCPNCGMNLRDDITECGYCGATITPRKEKAAAGAGRFTVPKGGTVQRGAPPLKKQADEPASDEEEEEGGLSAILQPGEQVLIGSLNVSVKKFSFHAYLTNQRIFLIDTQEKKLRVTAKDVARDTIAGCIAESSENSDPVLVLSLKSGDDEVKTMKLVFIQNGVDRSAEIDEWLTLLGEEEPPKKARKKTAPDREKPEAGENEEPAPLRIPEKPRQKQDLHPAKKPLKDHERQPPVKRLISPYKIPEEEPEQEEEPEPEKPVPQKRIPVRQILASPYEREIPSADASDIPPVRKPEVQSAMRVAIKGAAKQTPPVVQRPAKNAVVESPRRWLKEAEPEPGPAAQPRRPVVQEDIPEKQVPEKQVREDTAGIPQFCHNCGKRLPHSANFCPGCGTKLGTGGTLPHSRTTPSQANRKATRTDPAGHEHKPVPEDSDEDEVEEEKPVPTRPPVKKAPQGSEMTILHKFLRR